LKKIKPTLLILFIAIIWFITKSSKVTIENYQLNKKGINTKGIIMDVRNVGAKGVIRANYYFEVNSDRYQGWVDSRNYRAGDSINILFLKNNPHVNREREFIKENYD
jgi:hypothetical protein